MHARSALTERVQRGHGLRGVNQECVRRVRAARMSVEPVRACEGSGVSSDKAREQREGGGAYAGMCVRAVMESDRACVCVCVRERE